MILAATNILLRSHPSDPQYPLVERALAKLRQDHEVLCIAPQNLVEFWVVATRPPEDNGLGMTPAEVIGEMQRLRSVFHLLDGVAAMADTWAAMLLEALAAIAQCPCVSVFIGHKIKPALRGRNGKSAS